MHAQTTTENAYSNSATDTLVQAGDSVLPMSQLLSNEIPLIIISTVNGEMPDYQWVVAPNGLLGIGIVNPTKVPSSMLILQGCDTLYNSGPYVNDTSGLTVRIRGNTSAIGIKSKPYKLKLQQKADLLFRGDDAKFADKNWLLLTNSEMCLNAMVGNELARLLGQEWTPAYQFVNVVFNNQYKGIYLLSEAVNRNKTARVNVDKQTGLIVENDAYWWNEPLYVENPIRAVNYTFKYPESKDITELQLSEATRQLDILNTAIQDGTYPLVIDVKSWARWMLTHDLLGTLDCGGSNMFLTKYDNSAASLWKLGPVWDFDSFMGMNNAWANVHTSEDVFWIPTLFNSTNPSFTQQYNALWNEIAPNLLYTLLPMLDDFINSDLAAELNYYVPLSSVVQRRQYKSVDTYMQTCKSWFTSRVAWLNQAIITSLADEPASQVDDACYNLLGERVTNPIPGQIYIRRGRKYIWLP